VTAKLLQNSETVVIGKTRIENHKPPVLGLDSNQGFVGGPRLPEFDIPVLLTKYSLQTFTTE
jgi:hypothetical protein